jgi:hypothetical protein
MEVVGMPTYRVTVQTGDVRWGGTDANVSTQLLGVIADSGLKKLDNASDNFERGNIDRFDLPIAEELGFIDEIELKHDRAGLGDGWYVDWVEVMNLDTGVMSRAPFDRWLATGEGDGKVDVTKPVVVDPPTFDRGVIKTYYVGYRPVRRDNTTGSPLQFNEQMTWTETRGASVKHGEATSIKLGVELGAGFLSSGSKFSAEVSKGVTNETGAESASSVANQTTIAGTVAPGMPQTWIIMIYQDVLEGIAAGNGIEVPWEVRYPGHADILAVSGWLSDQEVADTVRRTLEAQTAGSGSGDPIPAQVQPDGMQFSIAARPISGAITPASVKDALEAIERDRLIGPSSPLGTNTNVVIHP